MTRFRSLAAILILSPFMLGGCIVGTAVSVAGDVAEGAVKTTGAVVGAAIPDGEKKKDRKEDD
ncbi:NF038104 family lipoprotein [Henriciella sp.]|uniref:NF038104 family lipoprotein n=1 Tax=Henriciella sp. TaxID=1968823 RepID=UPI00262745F2|nr:NF038104 family lipoprotein [Henriciella sp.]